MTESTKVAGKRRLGGHLPVVAIVGRPNVGKSTLFNRLIGHRRAIVHDLPGMTRDRISAAADWAGRSFTVDDTGGIEAAARDGIPAQVRRQALRAAAEADVVLLVVDVRDGALPVDAEIARELRRAGAAHLLLAANKADTMRAAAAASEFAALGIEPVFPISAETGLGLPELLDAIVERFPEPGAEEEASAPEVIQVALVGRPNVGKSTLFNQIAGDDRSVVSEVAGTTRDTVDVEVTRDGHRYRFLDTAGIRRPGRTERGPEVLSVVMARKTIERADVVILVLDATGTVAHQDAAVAGLADDAGKAIVIAGTKWDRVADPEARRKSLEEEIRRGLKFLEYASLITVSGVNGRGVPRLLSEVRRAAAAGRAEISTARLNRFVESSLGEVPLLAPGAREAHLLYATQTGTRPPTFTFFANRRVVPHFSTLRYLVNRLRDEFKLTGTPVRVRIRGREEKTKR